MSTPTTSHQTKKCQKNSDDTKKKLREKKQEAIENYAVSLASRIKGSKKHEKGNVGFKQTSCEVFVFLVIADATLRSDYQERFTHTRHFKKTVAFATVEELQKYMAEYSFPKNSIFLSVIDNFTETGSEEEQEKAAAHLKELHTHDPVMELIVLSERSDTTSAVKTCTPYGSVMFIKKTASDCFEQILNYMVVAIHEQDKIRKLYDTKQMIKRGSIVAVVVLVVLLIADFIAEGELIYILPRTWFLK
ncbi:MAG: hypothetical protein LBU90_08310 [Bacteroidales bacterium]|nr:hypothetical protein [Bacteroidales bacterium]